MTPEQQRYRTVFTHFANEGLHTWAEGEVTLAPESQMQSRTHILACQVPANTNSTGNNPLPFEYGFINYQMDGGVNKIGIDRDNATPSEPNRAGWMKDINELPDDGRNFKDGWVYRNDELKARWLHSDIKDMAYRYNHKAYDKIIQNSQLNLKP